MYTILSAVIFIGALIISLQWFFGIQKLATLKDEPTVDEKKGGISVSVIVAAKNEEQDIRKSIESLLQQSYQPLEIIVVNDRSTDRTKEILEGLLVKSMDHSSLYPPFKLITISELPEGWLGKNHALYVGAQHATGDWLLFADGDVFFSKNAISKAIHYVKRKKLDHLTLMPENIKGTWSYRSFHSYWSVIGIWNFIQLGHAGVGAFNLMKRTVYDAIGTHKALPLAPDDDLKLGKKVVQHGFKQQLGFGNGLIRIQWYENVKEVIQGLQKNLYAFMRYNFLVSIFFSLVIVLVHIVPFIGVFFSNPIAKGFHVATLLLYSGIYFYNSRYVNESPWFVITIPFNGAIFIYCILRSMLKAMIKGNVEWRGTHYSLKTLKDGARKKN
ncbi:glycosyltransferase family 2 protein [Evansella sp. AB-P1]|uniref:glycosyltransferase n=1 Tax=Evansella sp. AB-P1 TaxID=3037653 RepID=UPI00241F11A5|nr:glycosyltransferase family 2 protein [Evansella sp. AB-P1]MDG5786078.1 glycosyltransferase family 2 protein [Evansella sp. AB-P1]